MVAAAGSKLKKNLEDIWALAVHLSANGIWEEEWKAVGARAWWS